MAAAAASAAAAAKASRVIFRWRSVDVESVTCLQPTRSVTHTYLLACAAASNSIDERRPTTSRERRKVASTAASVRFYCFLLRFRIFIWGLLGSRVVSVLDSGTAGPGFKSQSRRCRVTVLGKLFTPIVPLFSKQRNW